jgi:hypothetical protein
MADGVTNLIENLPTWNLADGGTYLPTWRMADRGTYLPTWRMAEDGGERAEDRTIKP